VIVGLFQISGTPMDRLSNPIGNPAYGMTALVLSTTDGVPADILQIDPIPTEGATS